MNYTKSQRIVNALKQLEQFVPANSAAQDQAIHVLTGALISSCDEADAGDSDMIKLQFPGGPEFEVIGTVYLNLQILESAAHELHGDSDSNSPIALRARELSEHLWRKHDLH